MHPNARFFVQPAQVFLTQIMVALNDYVVFNLHKVKPYFGETLTILCETSISIIEYRSIMWFFHDKIDQCLCIPQSIKPAFKQNSMKTSNFRYILILCAFFDTRTISNHCSFITDPVLRLPPFNVDRNRPTSESNDPSNSKNVNPRSVKLYPNGLYPDGKGLMSAAAPPPRGSDVIILLLLVVSNNNDVAVVVEE